MVNTAGTALPDARIVADSCGALRRAPGLIAKHGEVIPPYEQFT
jgi:hypothetical protein